MVSSDVAVSVLIDAGQVVAAAKDVSEQLRAENAELRKRCEKLSKDARRYKWLRDVGDSTFIALGRRPGIQFSHQIDNAIDTAIDAALKEPKP
jgi:hypothetical protein